MKISIDVASRHEGDAIRAALDDAVVRAYVVIVGTLKPLPEVVRARVLNMVSESVMSDVSEP